MNRIFFLAVLGFISSTQITVAKSSENQDQVITIADTALVKSLNRQAFNLIHSKPSVAMDDVKIALNLANDIDFKSGTARSYSVIGSIYWGIGDYADALEYYIRAEKEYQKLNQIKGLASTYNNIGEIYKSLNDLDQALTYLNKSKKLYIQILGNDYPLIAYINIAEIYLEKNEFEIAETLYYKILNSKTNASARKLGYTYIGLGKIALSRGNYDSASSLFYKALESRKRRNDLRGVADAQINLAAAFMVKEKYSKSNKYLDSALLLSNKIKAQDLKLTALLTKSKIDSTEEDYKTSLKNYLRYTALKDSMFNQVNTQRIVNLQSIYDNELLVKESEAHLHQAEQQRLIVIGFGLALAICLITAIILFRQHKLQQRINKLLALKNVEINEQSKKLTTLNEKLEEKVQSRTELLMKQNEVLAQYAFVSAHELRAPVASILGLCNLLGKTDLNAKETEIITHLSSTTTELDDVMREMRYKIENNTILTEISLKQPTSI